MFSMDELRGSALKGRWNLQEDGRLLELMENLSKNIENRSKKTKSNVNEMLIKLDETKISLMNVTSKLLALQNNQFIENRVYEDDETIANISEVPKIDNTQNNVISTQEAAKNSLSNGLKVMEDCYDKIEVICDTDSFSDDGTGRTKNFSYRQIDPYDSALPYLIGTEDWKRKWHLGLVREPSTNIPVAGNQSNDDQQFNITPSSSLQSHSASASENSLYPHRSSSEILNQTQEEQISIRDSPKSDRVAPFMAPQHTPAILFPSVPPSDTIVQSKGLWDDSDDDNAIPPAMPEKRKQQISQQKPNDFFIGNKTNITSYGNYFDDQPPVIDEPITPIQKKPVNLFVDDEADLYEDDLIPQKQSLFDSQPPPIADISKPVMPATNMGLPKVLPSDLSAVKLKKPESNVKSIVSPGNSKAYKSSSPDVSQGTSRMEEKVATPVTSVSVKEIKPKKITNLFEDDEDDADDLFVGQQPKSIANKASVESVRKSSGLGLFGEDETDEVAKYEPPLPQVPKTSISSSDSKKTRKVPVNLFDDDDDDDSADIFASSSNKFSNSSQKSQTEKITSSVSSSKTPTSTKTYKNLFEDDDDEDIFGSSKNPIVSNSKKQEEDSSANLKITSNSSLIQNDKTPVDLFNDNNDFESFIEKKPQTKNKSEEEAKTKTAIKSDLVKESAIKATTKKISFFDSDDETDENDYFTKIMKSKTVAKDVKKPKKLSVFDDEDESDDLFGVKSRANNVDAVSNITNSKNQSNGAVNSNSHIVDKSVEVNNSDKVTSDKATNSTNVEKFSTNLEPKPEMGQWISSFLWPDTSSQQMSQPKTVSENNNNVENSDNDDIESEVEKEIPGDSEINAEIDNEKCFMGSGAGNSDKVLVNTQNLLESDPIPNSNTSSDPKYSDNSTENVNSAKNSLLEKTNEKNEITSSSFQNESSKNSTSLDSRIDSFSSWLKSVSESSSSDKPEPEVVQNVQEVKVPEASSSVSNELSKKLSVARNSNLDNFGSSPDHSSLFDAINPKKFEESQMSQEEVEKPSPTFSDSISNTFGSPPEDSGVGDLSNEKLSNYMKTSISRDSELFGPPEDSTEEKSEIFSNETSPSQLKSLTSPMLQDFLSSPPANSLQSALFLSDEPPPDDDDDWDQEPTNNYDADIESVPVQSSINYPSIPLFDELPPDDDFENLLQKQKPSNKKKTSENLDFPETVKDGNNNRLNNDIIRSKPKGPQNKKRPSIKKLRQNAEESIKKAQINAAIVENDDEEEIKETPVRAPGKILFLGELQGKLQSTDSLRKSTIKENEDIVEEPKQRARHVGMMARPHTSYFGNNPMAHKSLMNELFQNNPRFSKVSAESKLKPPQETVPNNPIESVAAKPIIPETTSNLTKVKEIICEEKIDSEATNSNNIKILNQIDDVLKTRDKLEALNSEKMFSKVAKPAENQKTIVPVKIEKVSKESSSLFGSDDDELFDKVKKDSVKRASVQNSKSLFDDDNDDGDDLFGSTKPKEDEKKVTKRPTSTIFEDSNNEDDDLFSSAKSSKASAIPAKIHKPANALASSNKIVKNVVKSSVVGDDPLGDLLG